MWRIWAATGIFLAFSVVLGWTYFEGRKSGILHVEQKIAEAVEKERQRMEEINRKAIADAIARVKALAELEKALAVQQAEQDIAADNDPDAGALGASRLSRINQVRNR